MTSKSRVVAVITAMVLVGTAAGCSDSGGVSTTAFVDKVDEVCRTLGNDLRDLTVPASSADVSAFAGGASKAYETALADLKQLEVPDDKAVVASAKGLVSNFDDQITTLDDIAAAAKAGDQTTVDAKIATFEQLGTDNNDLAAAVGASRCALDPLFAFEVAPPVTDPPVTDPPSTTAPADTLPPVTTVASTNTNKTVSPLATDLAPAQGYTFVETGADTVNTFIGIIDSAPTIQAQSGLVAGVEVVDGSGIIAARIFVYLPDTALSPTAADELLPIVTAGAATTPATYGALTGLTYTDGEKSFFIGTDNAAGPQLVMWAISTDQATLDSAINAFTFALAQ
jgi:hypothetical protein